MNSHLAVTRSIPARDPPALPSADHPFGKRLMLFSVFSHPSKGECKLCFHFITDFLMHSTPICFLRKEIAIKHLCKSPNMLFREVLHSHKSWLMSFCQR